jgi:SAM-dependent methyltransferase
VTHLPGVLALAVVCSALATSHRDVVARTPQTAQQPLDVIYVPTPPAVVRAMLRTAGVGAGDTVMDLGSGDGRIPIMAVKEFGAARGIGVDLDPLRIAEARANAAAAGISDRVEFLQQDLFKTDLTPATVITMYLLPKINTRLLPTLRALAPGTRIVSHNYDFGDAWKPARSLVVERNLVYFWIVPKH